ncbi:hypothetical protein LCGC14_2403110 [marine sediment metagenome]|uniref:RDD domain-containing protein n=1 Tax=marine sediment metagenome TaxID=412755 RepID=A0A0F9CGS9_9ZZZZ
MRKALATLFIDFFSIIFLIPLLLATFLFNLILQIDLFTKIIINKKGKTNSITQNPENNSMRRMR